MFSKSNSNNTTAIPTIKNENSEVSIYYNPANSEVSWSVGSNMDKVDLYSLSGTMLLKISQPGINSINLGKLHNGMYILKFYNHNRTLLAKKVVKN